MLDRSSTVNVFLPIFWTTALPPPCSRSPYARSPKASPPGPFRPLVRPIAPKLRRPHSSLSSLLPCDQHRTDAIFVKAISAWGFNPSALPWFEVEKPNRLYSSPCQSLVTSAATRGCGVRGTGSEPACRQRGGVRMRPRWRRWDEWHGLVGAVEFAGG